MNSATPIAEALRIPRTLLAPSPTNPRKHFDAARLAEMRESIARHGVLQPLVVRAIEGRDGSDGQPLYEIVSGERRWRASEGAQDTLPCMVQPLTDLEVLEIQVIENVQRDDLHPLEEADGYEQLLLDPPWWSPNHRPRVQGYSIDELALRIGKSRSHIYARLRLLGLTPAARHAFFEQAFGIGSALQIARLNTQHQEELVQALLHDAAKGAAWTADTISHTVQQRYMLRLAGAPFKLHDATLLPEAGACAVCPKRSGANPELFDDITEADTCADRACFARKCEAHEVQAIAIAEERGHTVITGIEAARLLPTPDATVKGYLRLDRPSEFALSAKPLAEVLGSDVRDVALIVRSNGAGVASTIVEVMPTPIVRQVLKDKGLLKAEDPPAAKPKKPAAHDNTITNAMKKAEKAVAGAAPQNGEAGSTISPALQKAIDELDVIPSHLRKGKLQPTGKNIEYYKLRTTHQVEQLLLAGLVGDRLATDEAEGLPAHGLGRLLLMQVWYGIGHESRPLIAGLAGLPASPDKHRDEDWIWSLSDEAAARALLVALALIEENEDEKPERRASTALSIVLDLDVTGLHDRAKQIVNAKLAAELAKIAPKPAAKKKPTAKAPAKKSSIKYRYALTGETWSGKGLQPKWLKVALASGRTLAEFDVVANNIKAQVAQQAAPTAQLSPVAAWPFPTAGDKITALQLDAARTHVITTQRASISSVQRALSVGYNQAARILEQLEQQKVVGPMDKEGHRKVLVKMSGEAV